MDSGDVGCNETVDTSAGWDGQSNAGGTAATRAAMVLVLECRNLLGGGGRVVLESNDEYTFGRGAASSMERDHHAIRLQVADRETSRRHFEIRRIDEVWQLKDLRSHNGTYLNGERVDHAELRDGDVIEAGGSILMFVEHAGDAEDRGIDEPPGQPFRTLNVELDRRLRQVAKIAPSDVPVLIRGETGTGKEVVARAIHDASGRSGAFVTVSCGALARNLIESELFGHRCGAFFGANEDREGLVRRAHGGTLFLDDLSELPLDSQLALGRVLQEGAVRPIGGDDAVKIDVRVIAASRVDLRTRILTGQFREGLYGQIAGFELTMPPLRKRREDLGMLVAAILPRIASAPERITLRQGAARALLYYPWPLNIRELEQTLRAAIALGDGSGEIRSEHLPPPTLLLQADQPPGSAAVVTRPLRRKDMILREQIVSLLESYRGNVAAVSRAMSRAPVQIRRWCTRLRIDLPAYRH